MTALGRDTIVICYHAVSPDWPIGLAVEPDRLDRQVSWLLERGYRPATFHQAVTAPPAAKTFAVTFDDGWCSVLEHGLPVLSRLGVPATVFVSTDYVDTCEKPLIGPELLSWLDGPHRHELFCLGWPQLSELADAGWEIGSHTMTHPWLTQVDDERLALELRGSKQRCEEALGRPCHTLAYPKGDFDERVERAAADAGYDAAATLPRRFPRPRRLAWPRISVQRGDSMIVFQAKVSRGLRLMRRSPAWPLVDGARRMLAGRPAVSGDP